MEPHSKQPTNENDKEKQTEPSAPTESEKKFAESLSPKKAAKLASKDEEVIAQQEEIAALKDKILRAQAEVENTRRIAKEELDKERKYGIANFAKDVSHILDNLYRGIESVSEEQLAEDPLVKSVYDGMVLTKDECERTLEKYGIKRVFPIGEKLDHHLHQAMSQLESADHEPGTIIQVIQAGYTIQDRVLKPAMVVVAKAAEPKDS